MKKIALLTAVFSLLAFAPDAMAKSYVWEDPDFGFTIQYPDHWKAQGGLTPQEQLQLLAPQGDAQCTFEASEDRRFLVYPRRFDKEILSSEFDWDHWENMTSNYQDRLFHFDKVGSIGSGDGRYTVVDYSTQGGSAKRELIFASIYGDMSFVARCVSSQHNYDQFFDTFMKMISSIDFEPAYSTHNNGYYRNFMGDGYVKPKEPTLLTKILSFGNNRRIYTAQ